MEAVVLTPRVGFSETTFTVRVQFPAPFCFGSYLVEPGEQLRTNSLNPRQLDRRIFSQASCRDNDDTRYFQWRNLFPGRHKMWACSPTTAWDRELLIYPIAGDTTMQEQPSEVLDILRQFEERAIMLRSSETESTLPKWCHKPI